jgi:transposase
VGHGETVIDVPATLTARTRRLSGHSGRKTRRARRPLGRYCRCREPSAASRATRRLLGRARGCSSTDAGIWCLINTRPSPRLHTLLADLQPAGAKLHLSIAQATRLLQSLRPVTTIDVERKQIAQELLADWRWLHKRIPDVTRRIHDALAAHGCTLADIYGIGDIGAATIVAIVGDVHRFPTRGHFAAFNSHHAAGRLLR